MEREKEKSVSMGEGAEGENLQVNSPLNAEPDTEPIW